MKYKLTIVQVLRLEADITANSVEQAKRDWESALVRQSQMLSVDIVDVQKVEE